MNKQLRKAGANWVDGDRFFDREAEIEALMERVREGTHTLLTAQRRMGKTSLVRELLRRLNKEGISQLYLSTSRVRMTQPMQSRRSRFRPVRSITFGAVSNPALPTNCKMSAITSRRLDSPT